MNVSRYMFMVMEPLTNRTPNAHRRVTSSRSIKHHYDWAGLEST